MSVEAIKNPVEAEIERVVQSVNEWDDRTSPDDYPEHLLITSEELADILRNFADATLESLQREKEASEATATRYANEIIELRGELAKTASLLVVQADRADAAEAELDSRTKALDEAEAGMKRLRETLHPFAEAADYYSTGVHRTPAPDALPCGPALIVAHLRAARTALASTGGEHDGN